MSAKRRDSGSAGETDESRGNREPLGENQNPPAPPRKNSGFGQTIKALFRQAKTALTNRSSGPQPGKRRRKEESGRAVFTMAAVKIIRRTARWPENSVAVEDAFDNLAWLHLWQGSALDTFADFHHADHYQDHSLHL